MATELKKLTVDASNGSFTFEVVDAEAREKANAAKAAAEAIKVPTALPNPNKLTFTGGATGTYDGSKPVTINIPTGGEGGSGSSPNSEGLTADRRNTLIAVVNAIGVFSVPNGQELIDAFNAAWSGGEEEPDEPVVPDVPEANVSQVGSILTISGVSDITKVAQSGTVLTMT